MCQKIISPNQIKSELGLTAQQREQITSWRNENKNIIGVMIESNINFGNQKFDPCKDNKNELKYGVSITDECVSLQQTDELFKILKYLG